MAPRLAASQTNSLLGALGIDWRTLLLYALAFLIVAWLMERLVYPSLIKALDTKREELAAAERLKAAAGEELAAARDSAMKIIVGAHHSAEEVIEEAHFEATGLIKTAKTEAAKRADRVLTDGKERLEREVRQAEATLKRQAATLAAEATKTLLHQHLTAAGDAELITGGLEGKP